MKVVSVKQANKRNILYYPTINIPTDDWLRNAVLYWDEVSSIVPQDWENKHLIELSPDIRYLMDEGQFRSIRPDALIKGEQGWDLLNEFQNELIDIIESDKFQAKLRNEKIRYTNIHGAKIPKSGIIGKGSRVHVEKMLHSVF